MNPLRNSDSDERIAALYRKYRILLLLAFAAALVPLATAAAQIETDNAIERWLGDSDPAIQRYDEFCRTFSVHPQLTAVAENITPDDHRMVDFAERLEALPFVRKVWTPQRIAEQLSTMSPPPQHLSGTSAVVRGNPVSSMSLLQGTPLARFFVPDGRSTMLRVDLTPEAIRDSQKSIEAVRSVATAAGIPAKQLHLGGPVVINGALDYESRVSLQSLLPVVAAVCGISLWFFVGRFGQAFLIFCSAGISIVATLGVMALAGTKLNLLLIALPPLVGVLHFSIGIHLLHHFNEAPTDGRKSAAGSLGYAVRNTLLPSSLATLTTIVGMASLMVSDLTPVRSFGLWSAVGTLLSLVVAYSFVPCFLVRAKRCSDAPMKCSWISPAFYQTRRIIFAASFGLLLISLAGWERLTPEFNALRFLPRESRTLRDYAWIETHCGGLVPVEFEIDLHDELNPIARIAKLRNAAHRLEEHRAVTHALGIHSYLPTAGGNNESIGAARRPFPNWVSADGNRFRLSALVRSDDPENLGTLIVGLQERLGGFKGEATGLITLIDRSQQAIYVSLRDSLLMACVLIGMLLVVLFRSISAGLVALVPNVLPIVVGFGVISWMGIPLDVGTLLTASIALGVALDDSLHFLHHFRLNSQSSHNLGRQLRKTWQVCSWPMIQTTFIAGAGLLVLALSSFRPIAHFGGLMVALLWLALAADLVLLPYLLTTRFSRLFRHTA